MSRPEVPRQRAGRTTRMSERLTRRAASIAQRVDEARAERPVLDGALHVIENDRRRNGSLLAGAVAFRLFTFLMPVTLLLVGVLGALLRLRVTSASGALGAAGITGSFVDSVATAAEQARRGWWLTLLLTITALVTIGVPTLRTIRAVHAAAWGLPDPPKVRIVPALATMTGMVTLLVGTGAAVNGIRSGGALGTVLTGVAAAALYGAAWLLVSRMLPHAPGAPWHALVPGAALVGLGSQVFAVVVVVYVRPRLESSSELYGSMGVALTVLLALYLVGRLLVSAAVLNATLWERGFAGGTPGENGLGERATADRD